MSHVFISYAYPDLVSAQLVEARLKAAGIDAWLDRADLLGGEEWMSRIRDSIASARAILLILSKHSNSSHFVTYECAYAMGKGVRVIPLLFSARRDLHPWIKQLQYLDFTNPGFAPWDNLLHLLTPARSSEQYAVPDPPSDFRHYTLGNFDLPIMPITGSPQTPFKMSEVTIEYKPVVYHDQPGYPQHLLSAKHFLEKEYISRYKYKKQQLEPTPLIRISNWEQEGETLDDHRGGLRLEFELTTFDTYLTTNRSLDCRVIPADTFAQGFSTETIRRAYVRFPYDLKQSVLANPLAVMIAIISRNPNQQPCDQVVIQFRGDTVASYRNRYQVAAAGYVSIAHTDADHKPNPFVTAAMEASQEVADSLSELQPCDFNLIGLALSWVDMLPLAYGYFITDIPARQVIGDFSRDGYEGRVSTLPFDPHVVLAHIADNKWTPDGAFAMCAALLARFPREEVEKAASKVTLKRMRDFFE